VYVGVLRLVKILYSLDNLIGFLGGGSRVQITQRLVVNRDLKDGEITPKLYARVIVQKGLLLRLSRRILPDLYGLASLPEDLAQKRAANGNPFQSVS
jgi:hypothetical protein